MAWLVYVKACLDSMAGSGRGDIGNRWILSEIRALAIERWGVRESGFPTKAGCGYTAGGVVE
ncbi:MAG TPA: hypothetical protein DIT89_01000 [Planctomycetaceae bacterium]|nr:hypothetical protein [Planctomycetaceae bacterium]